MQPTQQLLVNVSTPEFRHSCPMQHQPPKRDRMEERQFELLALLEISVMQHPFPRENDWRRRNFGQDMVIPKRAQAHSATPTLTPLQQAAVRRAQGDQHGVSCNTRSRKRTTGGDAILNWIWSSQKSACTLSHTNSHPVAASCSDAGAG